MGAIRRYSDPAGGRGRSGALRAHGCCSFSRTAAEAAERKGSRRGCPHQRHLGPSRAALAARVRGLGRCSVEASQRGAQSMVPTRNLWAAAVLVIPRWPPGSGPFPGWRGRRSPPDSLRGTPSFFREAPSSSRSAPRARPGPKTRNPQCGPKPARPGALHVVPCPSSSREGAPPPPPARRNWVRVARAVHPRTAVPVRRRLQLGGPGRRRSVLAAAAPCPAAAASDATNHWQVRLQPSSAADRGHCRRRCSQRRQQDRVRARVARGH